MAYRERILISMILFNIVVLLIIFQITLMIGWFSTSVDFIKLSLYIHAGFLVLYFSLLVNTFVLWFYTKTIKQLSTKTLTQPKYDHIDQLYRFAEFGKLSAGIFHDFLNLLTAVSLSVSKLSDEQSSETSTKLQQSISTAVQTTKRMDQFITVVKKQMKSDELHRRFSVNNEIEDAIDLLDYHAKEVNVIITLHASQEYFLENSTTKFSQIAINLICNAIESYIEQTSPNNREIIIDLRCIDNYLQFQVYDNGTGISTDIANRIFEPFFTTKHQSIGLGLSTIKDIVEKNFSGTLTYISTAELGTTFTVLIPFCTSNSILKN